MRKAKTTCFVWNDELAEWISITQEVLEEILRKYPNIEKKHGNRPVFVKSETDYYWKGRWIMYMQTFE